MFPAPGRISRPPAFEGWRPGPVWPDDRDDQLRATDAAPGEPGPQIGRPPGDGAGRRTPTGRPRRRARPATLARAGGG